MIAEGVETREHVDHLRERGCDQLQGYWYDGPQPPDVFERRWLGLND